MKLNQLNRKEFENGYVTLISYLNNFSNNILDKIDWDDSEHIFAMTLDEEIHNKYHITIRHINSNNVLKYIDFLESLRDRFVSRKKTSAKRELNELTKYSPYIQKEKLVVKNISDFKLSVQTNNYSIMDFLNVNPFDNLKNFNGDLTPEIFFDKLFVKSSSIEQFQVEISKLVSSESSNNSFIYLTGMAGIGKTTFLNYYISKNRQYQHDYYNCELYSSVVNFNDLNNTSTVFASIFKRRLFEIDEEQIISAFKYIISNKPFLFTFLPDLYYKFETFYAKNALIKRDEKSFLDLIFSFDDYEIAIFYFLIKIYNKVAKDQENIPEIIYFDNLDSFSQKLLNESLLDFFPRLYVALNNIVSSSNLIFKRINFARNYKFVFCLREHNISYLNSHTFDRLLSNSYNAKLTFLTSSANIVEVIKKRIQLHQELAKKSDINRLNHINEALNIVIDKEELIKSIQRIYNYDYRKIITFIFQEVTNLHLNSDYKTSFYKIENILRFNLSKRLVRSSILRKYNTKDLNNFSKYCNVERLVLTTLLNLSKSPNLYETSEVSIYEVINWYQKANLIDNELVFEVLTEMLSKNLFEQVNFIGLNDSNYNYNSSVKDIKKTFLNFILSKNEVCDKEEIREFKTKFITIYPSAISYIERESIDFEFYSALVGNEMSLYELIYSGIDNLSKNIELNIKRVINLVDEEVKYNDNIYLKAQRENLLEDYEIGFSFLVPGFELSHLTRIINSHLFYLEKFRRYIIDTMQLDSKLKKEINLLLIQTFNSYLKLLINKKSLSQESGIINQLVENLKIVDINKPLKITTPNILYK